MDCCVLTVLLISVIEFEVPSFSVFVCLYKCILEFVLQVPVKLVTLNIKAFRL